MRDVSSSATLRTGVERVESQSTQEGGAAEEHNEIIEGKAPGREPAHGAGPAGFETRWCSSFRWTSWLTNARKNNLSRFRGRCFKRNMKTFSLNLVEHQLCRSCRFSVGSSLSTSCHVERLKYSEEQRNRR